jgi:cytidylate kinase
MASPFPSLSPSLELRLSAWLEVRERLLAEQKPRLRPTITLSRAFGCEAFPLAKRLAEVLQQRTGETWLVHDKTLLEAMAKEELLPLESLKKHGYVTGGFETLWLGPSDAYLRLKELDAVSKVLVHVAQLGNAIIVGRAGAALTRNLKNCFHFRLEGSLEHRIRSIARRLSLSRAEAEDLVKAGGAERDRFMAERLKVNLSDVTLYDAVFNDERHSGTEVAAAIVAYVEQAWPEPALFSSAQATG